MPILKDFINNEIRRRKEKIIAHAVSAPYLLEKNSKDTWVVDLVYQHDKQLLNKVPIAENNRQIRNFITENTPVELQKSNAGQLYVSGLANIKKGQVKTKRYSIQDNNIMFSYGIKRDSSSNIVSGNGNAISNTSLTDETTQEYEFEIIPFGDLNFGVTAFGAKRLIES